MTSSPEPIPKIRKDNSKAVAPDVVATANLALTYFANLVSKFRVIAPSVTKRDFKTLLDAFISLLSIKGTVRGIFFLFNFNR